MKMFLVDGMRLAHRLLSIWRTWWWAGFLSVGAILFGCDGAQVGKEKAYRYVIDGELFVVPRKYSPKSAWASERPEGENLVTAGFNYAFVYPQMISWDEARRKGVSHEHIIGGMLYVDRHPNHPNPWMIFGHKEPGDPRKSKSVQYGHVNDLLRDRAATPHEKQNCLTGGEYDSRLDMTRYVLNDTPEHHPSYYSEIYIRGGNTCTPDEWLECGMSSCKTVVRFRDRFAITYDFNKQFLHEHSAVRQAIFDKLESFRDNGKGDK